MGPSTNCERLRNLHVQYNRPHMSRKCGSVFSALRGFTDRFCTQAAIIRPLILPICPTLASRSAARGDAASEGHAAKGQTISTLALRASRRSSRMRPEHVQEGEIMMAAAAHCHRHRYHPPPSVACILALAPLQSPSNLQRSNANRSRPWAVGQKRYVLSGTVPCGVMSGRRSPPCGASSPSRAQPLT